MNYQLSLLIVLALASTTLFSSCKKEGCTDEKAENYDSDADKDDDSCTYPEEEETDDIDFTISDPVAGTTFGLGDTVHINTMITTTGEVHGYEVYLRNTSNNNEVVFESKEHAHDSPVHIHEMWVNDVSSHSDMELEIVLITDHDGATETQKVSFHCHPM